MRSIFLITFAICAMAVPVSAQNAPQTTPPPAPTPPPDPVGDNIKSVAGRVTGGEPTASASGGLGSLTADLFTGSARYQIALPLPALRGFEAPPPMLVYDARGGNGVAGVGWTFTLGSIEADRAVGEPSKIEYRHVSAGGAVTLRQLAPNEYGVDVAPPMSRYHRDAAGWTVSDADGSRFQFDALVAPAMARSWLLTRGEDPSGNFFSVQYATADNYPYMSKVSYGGSVGVGGSPALTPNVEYAFTYEARPDVRTQYLHGTLTTLSQRLASAALVVGGKVQRIYKFSYAVSGTGRSLLTKVVEVAPSGATRTLLDFDYSAAKTGFEDGDLVVPANASHVDDLKWTGVVGAQSQFLDFRGGNAPRFCAPEGTAFTCRPLDGGVPASSTIQNGGLISASFGDLTQSLIRPVDLNSDGLVDVCLTQSASISCWLNASGRMGSTVAGPAWSVLDKVTVGSMRWGDVNGDGFPDVCRVAKDEVECVPGGADGFALDPAKIIHGPAWGLDTPGPQGFTRPWRNEDHYSTITLIDIDNDQTDDICGRTPERVRCYRGTAAGFDLASPIDGPAWDDVPVTLFGGTPPPEPRTKWQEAQHYGTISWPDLDGDRLPDICARDADGVICYRNTGKAFDLAHPIRGPEWSGVGTPVAIPAPPPPPPSPPGSPPPPPPPVERGWHLDAHWRTIGFYDINGDDLPDACARDKGGFVCYIGTGTGFGTKIDGPAIADDFEGNFLDGEFYRSIRVVDVNGDGHPDICARTRKGVRCWRNKLGLADLLIGVHENMGGSVALTYGPASATVRSRIPYATPVLASYTRDDGRGMTATMGYAYADGYFDMRTRGFRGFGSVTETTFDGGQLVRRRITRFSQATATQAGQKDDRGATFAPFKGRPLSVITGLPKGDGVDPGERQTTSYRYAVSEAFGRQVVTTSSIETSACSGGVCDTAPVLTEYEYDRGYVKRIAAHALPGVPDDDMTTRYSYNWEPSGQPFARVSVISRLDGIGTELEVQRTTFSYDESHACDPQAATTSAPAWGRGLITSVVTSAGALSERTLAGFDAWGNSVCAWRADTGKVTTTFDAQSHTFAVASTNAMGHVEARSFGGVDGKAGPYGMIVQQVAVNGAKTSFAYDDFLRLSEVDTPVAGKRKYTYLDIGLPASQRIRTTSPTGLWSESWVDGNGRDWKRTRPSPTGSVLAEFTQYDALGRTTGSTMPPDAGGRARVTRLAYDWRDRITVATAITGTVTRFCYRGRVETEIASSGRRVDRQKDELGRLVRVTEYSGTTNNCNGSPGLRPTATIFRYDRRYGVSSITGAGRQIRMFYDGLGRRREVIDTGLGRSTFDYDASGLLRSLTTHDKVTTTYEYDLIGRPLSTTRRGSTGPAKQTRFVYDSSREGTGRLTGVVREGSAISNFYRRDGLLATVVRTIGGRSYVVNRQYDGDGNLLQLVHPDGYATRYRNVDGYLRDISDDQGTLIAFNQIDELGRPTEIAYRNGTTTRHTYAGGDARWCPENDLYLCGIAVTQTADNAVIWNSRQRVNANREIVEATDSVLGDFVFRYDEQSRLQTATSTKQNFKYDYDPQDNMVASTGQTFAYRADPATPGASRLIRAVGGNYDYNAAGQVKAIRRGGTSVGFDYDSTGRLAAIHGNSEVALQFDDDRLVHLEVNGKAVDLIDGIAECSSPERCIDTVYVAGALAVAVNGHSGTYHFYHTDVRGSIIAVTDASGRIVRRYAYGPYGERIGEAKDDPAGLLLRRGYVGGFQLPDGLVLLGARVYDPRIGRFLQPDEESPPIEVMRRANLYSYGYDNPLSYTDPNGKFGFLAAVLIGALIGGATAAITHQNILEGALFGAIMGGAGFYAVQLGTALVGSTYWGAVLGQASLSAAQAAFTHRDVGQAFVLGAVSGAVGAGLGRATMKVIPVPEVETAGGAFGRQALRDFTRGAARTVVMNVIRREDHPFEGAIEAGAMEYAYGFAQTVAFAGYASLVAEGEVTWQGHSFVVPTTHLPENARAMRLGMFTLTTQHIASRGYDYTPLPYEDGASAGEILDHEDEHGSQYNVLGVMFLPSYLSDWASRGGGEAGYWNSPYERAGRAAGGGH